MPSKSHDELKELVAQGEIGAISLDTSIFDRFACNLDSPSLEALEQFIGSPVQVLLTDVVLGEVRNHLIKSAADKTASLESALKSFERVRPRRRLAATKARALLRLSAEIDAEADNWIAAYLEQVQPEVLKASEHIDTDKLLKSYFAAEPPFENAKDKKCEFPDAIALRELENWAMMNEKFVLAVSNDKGWLDFADSSERLLVITDLPEALGFFHQADQHIVERTISLLGDKEKYQLAAELNDVLVSYVDDLSPWIDAESPFQFQATYYGAQLTNWTVPEPSEFTVISSDDETVSITAKFPVLITAEAEFGFYVHDSGDDISVGDAYVEKDVSMKVPIVVKVARESGPDDVPAAMSYELRSNVALDFGYVEPEMEDE